MKKFDEPLSYGEIFQEESIETLVSNHPKQFRLKNLPAASVSRGVLDGLNSLISSEPSLFSDENLRVQSLNWLKSGFASHLENHSKNPLLSAANLLFVTLFQFWQKGYRVSESSALQEDLISKMNDFSEQAKQIGYHSRTVLAARYLLCVWIDEIIDASPIAEKDSYQPGRLQAAFQFDLLEDRFFLILNHALQHLETHVDLLELIYICLSLGFKGPYKYHSDGEKDLAVITDHLYHQIRSIRGGFSKQLFIKTDMPKVKKNFAVHTRRIWWLPFCFALGASLSVLIINYRLIGKMAPIFQKLTALL